MDIWQSLGLGGNASGALHRQTSRAMEQTNGASKLDNQTVWVRDWKPCGNRVVGGHIPHGAGEPTGTSGAAIRLDGWGASLGDTVVWEGREVAASKHAHLLLRTRSDRVETLQISCDDLPFFVTFCDPTVRE